MKQNQNLKPFDLEAALQGAAVVTRAGKEVSEVVVLKTLIYGRNLFAVIDGQLYSFYYDGKVYENEEYKNDLFMKPVQVTKWVNIYCSSGGFRTGIYTFDSEEQAKKSIDEFNSEYYCTVPMTFEV